jgi:transposase
VLQPDRAARVAAGHGASPNSRLIVRLQMGRSHSQERIVAMDRSTHRHVVGIDVYKQQLDVHIWPVHQAMAFDNSLQGIAQLVKRLGKHDVSLIVIESTDRDDALKLAKLSATGELPTVYLPAANVRRWRSLIVYRHKLVGRRTAIYNRIRALLDSVGLSHPSGKSGWSKQNIQSLHEQSRPLADCAMQELWRGELSVELEQLEYLEQCIVKVETKLDAIAAADARVKRVRTIPGVGPRLGELVVAMLDDPHRFGNARQVGSYAGLVPRRHQSGTHDHYGRITKQGCALLRKLLVEIAWAMRRHNPEAKAWFDRVSKGEKTRRKQTAVGLGRKVLTWCWALLRDERDWTQSPPEGLGATAG